MSWKTERQRGAKEARAQFAALQAHWPQAFPEKSHLVRPLAGSIVPEISEKLNWSRPYTRSVLNAWKRRQSYCKAVLRYTERVHLDGSLSGQPVEDEARVLAEAQLERIAAAKAARAAREQAKQPETTQAA